jgi:hypothetical protein
MSSERVRNPFVQRQHLAKHVGLRQLSRILSTTEGVRGPLFTVP